MLVFLLGWGVSAQTTTVTCTTDVSWFTEQIEAKDKKIETLQIHVDECNIVIKDYNVAMDSLQHNLRFYRAYYDHSKHVLAKRIITRIEEMVANDE